MTFLISLPIVFRRTIGLKDFGKSYDSLLDFRITTIVDFLKWSGQCPFSKHVLAMLMMFFKHILFLIICLRYLYESLSRPGTDKLLQFLIAWILLSKSLTKRTKSKNRSHWVHFYQLLKIMLCWMTNEELAKGFPALNKVVHYIWLFQ